MPMRSVCPDCYDGHHSGCIGNGCYCDCQLEEDRVAENTREEMEARFKGCSIHMQKDGPRKNWYITVTAKSGGHLYDGYWSDSEDKTAIEALAEAKKGSCLT